MNESSDNSWPGVLGLLRRSALPVALAAILGAAIGVVFAQLRPDQFVATTAIVVEPSPSTGLLASFDQPEFDFPQVVSGEAGIVRLPTLRLIAEDVDPAVDVSVKTNGKLITIAATSAAPEDAETAMRRMIEAYIELRTNADARELLALREAMEARIDELMLLDGSEEAIADVELLLTRITGTAAALPAGVQVLDDSPIAIEADRQPLLWAALGALLLFAVALLIAYAFLDRRSRRRYT